MRKAKLHRGKGIFHLLADSCNGPMDRSWVFPSQKKPGASSKSSHMVALQPFSTAFPGTIAGVGSKVELLWTFGE